MEKNKFNDTIFTLDIGTRSVIGMLALQEDDCLRIFDMEILEYKERAMIDGQIEDIEKVALVAQGVKEALQKRNSLNLSRVHVAAAGRALQTCEASFELALTDQQIITRDLINQLELGAIDRAALTVEQKEKGFYCIAHSVVNYYLDDYKISNLLGHKGSKIGVDIIVTFLPRGVVESLYAVIEKIGSKVESLTLEPIAALNAVIPKEIQLLNLALVDIGAGTSDIAVTEGGSVKAYTMATSAGDEITEAVINRFLVDFEMGEKIKIALSGDEEVIEFTDVLGVKRSTTKKEVLEVISPALKDLCQVISKRIEEVNQKPPRAVFLVGGGSKAPLLQALLAENLKIEEDKIAIGGNNYMKKAVESEMDLTAPEFATPVGITLTAALLQKSDAGAVTVNGKQIRVFGDGSVPLSNILLSAGYTYDHIIGRIGRRLSCFVEGNRHYFSGGQPEPAKVKINGRVASLGSRVSIGDIVEIISAKGGRDAAPVISEAFDPGESFEVTFDGLTVRAGNVVYCNGEEANPNSLINEGDRLETVNKKTLGDLAFSLGEDDETFFVNGELRGLSYVLRAGDEVVSAQKKALDDSMVDLSAIPAWKRFEFNPEFEPKQVSPEAEGEASCEAEGEGTDALSSEFKWVPGTKMSIILNGKNIDLPPRNEPYRFLDVFNYIDIRPEDVRGDYKLLLNGKEAESFMEILKPGDKIQVDIG